MSNRFAIRLIAIILCLFTSQSGLAQQKSLKELQEYFKALQDGPYVLLEAPRTGLGIGTTYITTSRQTLYYTRPEDCFTETLLSKVSGEVAIPGKSAVTANVSAGVGLKIAGVGPITEPLAAELKKSRASSVELQISELDRKLLTISELKRQFRIATDEACISAFDPKATPARYIVIEALYAKNMKLIFKNDQGQDVSLSVGLLAKFFPKFNFNGKTTWTGAIEFSNSPHVVAIKSVRVKDVTAMSGSTALDFEVAPESHYYSGK